jgi:hypothetical protein
MHTYDEGAMEEGPLGYLTACFVVYHPKATPSNLKGGSYVVDDSCPADHFVDA